MTGPGGQWLLGAVMSSNGAFSSLWTCTLAVLGHAQEGNMSDSLYDDIRTNYNEVGALIIQRLFGEGYLSPCGEAATDRLASLAGPSQSSRILDVGSGLGGAAMRLAQRFGCSVTGLDLVESNVHTASKSAHTRGLAHLLQFQPGDATAMPFADDSFSMVWSQDAWCHVPDRDAVIGECARVLEPGGTIVFADWLLTGAEDDAYRLGYCRQWPVQI